MKKSFYLAALAMIALSSCSSEDVVTDSQEASQNEGLVPVSLSVGNAVIGVSTRGTGTVGSVAAAEATDNNWHHERIRVLMTDDNSENNDVTFTTIKGLLPVVDNQGNPITIQKQEGQEVKNVPIYYGQFDNYFYCSPVVGESSVSLVPQPKDGMQRYYPVNGKCRFFAYYVDDAKPTNGWNYVLPKGTDTTKSADPTKSPTLDDDVLVPELKDDATTHSKYVEFKIDGSQDIMAGLAFDNGNASGAYTFSAAGARKATPQRPVICMDHLLTRLAFTYTAGNGDGIEGVVIKSVEVESQTEGKLTVAYNSAPKTADQLITWTANEAPSFLALQDALPDADRYAGGVKKNLIPFVAKVIATGDNKKEMGDALFVRPDQHEYNARVTLLFPIKENPADYDPNGDNPDYNEEVLTVTLSAGANASDKFERGKSYQINFTFYGYQNADVNVQLTGWINGGEISPDFLGDVDN